jgi:hypothetical protein
MNSESTECCKSRLAYIIAILGACLIVAGLVLAMRHYIQPPAMNAARAAERSKVLGEIRAADAEAAQNVGWIDQPKGIVRLRVADALQISEREWKNPAAARSNLIARVDKANPPPPPPKPSPLE